MAKGAVLGQLLKFPSRAYARGQLVIADPACSTLNTMHDVVNNVNYSTNINVEPLGSAPPLR